MDEKQIISGILERKPIDTVIFIACGGSLTDLYNGHFLLQCESAKIRSYWMNANEFLHAVPKAFSENTLVIACSHSGNTAETVRGALYAQEHGASVIALTYNAGSKLDLSLPNYTSIVYEWGEGVSSKAKPEGIVLALVNELLSQREPGYGLYDAIRDGLDKIDGIVAAACKKIQNSAWLFAQAHSDAPMLYILGSGSAFSQAYAMAICSLQEMQWMDCCYIHSGEYFHGPFECTDGKTPYILMKSLGKTRALDQRAEAFLAKYAGSYEVIDAKALGLDAIAPEAVEYFNCPLFYKMACVYRDALDYTRRHPLDMRRYMGVVDY